MESRSMAGAIPPEKRPDQSGEADFPTLDLDLAPMNLKIELGGNGFRLFRPAYLWDHTGGMMKTKNIRQSVQFKAAPLAVYEAMMDVKKHARFTGASAKISRKVGGGFSAYDGYCEGKNLELKAGKTIVQSWRSSDWPEGHFSTVTFEMAKNSRGTQLRFSQTGIPESQVIAIREGWKEFYWKPMKKMFAGG